MRKFIFALATVLSMAGCAGGSDSPQMKVIVCSDGFVARYVSEDDTSYTGEIQDTFTVPKKDASVEVWRACDGKGMVSLRDFGETAVYAAPDTLSDVVGTIQYEQGFVPDSYACLGYRDGWFEIALDAAHSGFVISQTVVWDVVGE